MSTTLPHPRITVIVPVWNNPTQLRECVAALEAQTIPRDQIEIIIVDNGSTDDTLAVAQAMPGVLALSEPTPGSYAARNTGLAHANAPIIAFTDSDCRPTPGWLAAGLAALADDPAIGIATGPIRLFDVDAHGNATLRRYEELFSFPQNVALANIATANWMVPRALLTEMGGFDTTTRSGGDKLLAVAIRNSGRRLAFVPAMIVEHPVRATASELIHKRRRLIGGRWNRAKHSHRYFRGMKGSAGEILRRARRVMAVPDYSTADRAALIGVVIGVSLLDMIEYSRLAAGLKPVR